MPASEGPVWHAVLRASPVCLELPEGQQGCDGKDMVGKAAGIGMLLFDLAAGLLHQQPVEDVKVPHSRWRECSEWRSAQTDRRCV